jgi:tryptophan-rich sensory protein
LGAILSAIILRGDYTWYSMLSRPFFSLPTWFMTEVWLVLYPLMAIALYLVLTEGKGKHKTLVIIFCINALLPIIRAFFFWQLHYLGLALLIAVLYWFLTIGITITAWHISRRAGMLMLPVVFYAIFNLIIYISLFLLNT